MVDGKLESILKQLVWKCKDDPSAASVTLSYLHYERVFYGSLIRYHKAYGKEPKVIASCKRTSIAGVLVYLGAEVNALPEPERMFDFDKETNIQASNGFVDDDDIPF